MRNRLPVTAATVAQSKALHTEPRMIDPGLFAGFNLEEVTNCKSAAMVSGPLMDTCMRGIAEAERLVQEEPSSLPKGAEYFDNFPYVLDEIYQRSALATIEDQAFCAAITRALIDRHRVSNGPRSTIESRYAGQKYSEGKRQKYIEYLTAAYTKGVVRDGVLESTRTIGALLEVVPHIFAAKGLERTIPPLRERLLFRAARSTLLLANDWVKTTRENDANLVTAIERDGSRCDTPVLTGDKYFGMRFDPEAFEMSGYRVGFRPDLQIASDERKSFGCPTNHQGHTARLFRVMLLGAVKSGALDYTIENSAQLLASRSKETGEAAA